MFSLLTFSRHIHIDQFLTKSLIKIEILTKSQKASASFNLIDIDAKRFTARSKLMQKEKLSVLKLMQVSLKNKSRKIRKKSVLIH